MLSALLLAAALHAQDIKNAQQDSLSGPNFDRQLPDVEIKAALGQGPLPHPQQISGEQIRRQAGGLEDPMRSIVALPGMSPSPDVDKNGGLLYGNLSSHAQWYLNGLPIFSLNHLRTTDGRGGGLNALFIGMIDRVEVQPGFSSSYQRSGQAGWLAFQTQRPQPDSLQLQLGVGLLGTDAFVQTPLYRDSLRAVYLSGAYRFSTLRLMGLFLPLDYIPIFQDATFQIHGIRQRPGRHFSEQSWAITGVGGYSYSRLSTIDSIDRQSGLDAIDRRYRAHEAVVSYTSQWAGSTDTLYAGLGWIGTQMGQYAFYAPPYSYTFNREAYSQQGFSLAMNYLKRLYRRFQLRLGMEAVALDQRGLVKGFAHRDTLFRQRLDYQKGQVDLRPFVQLSYQSSKGSRRPWKLSLGSAARVFTRPSNAGGELFLNWAHRPFTIWKWSLSAGRSLRAPDPAYQQLSTTELDLLQNHGLRIGQTWRWGNWRWSSAAFAHLLQDLPADLQTAQVSSQPGLRYRMNPPQSAGEQLNQGFHTQLSYQGSGWAAWAQMTRMVSRYRILEGSWHNGYGFTGNTYQLFAHKSWILTKNKRLGMQASLGYYGSPRLPELDLAVSRSRGTEFFAFERGFNSVPAPYWMGDLSLQYEVQGKHIRHQLLLYIKNINRAQPIVEPYFDREKSQTSYRRANGLVPVLTYRVGF